MYNTSLFSYFMVCFALWGSGAKGVSEATLNAMGN